MAKKKPDTYSVADEPLTDEEKILLEGGGSDISGTEIKQWAEGSIVKGKLVKLKPGKFGKLLVIETDDGLETWGCPTILADRLDDVAAGAKLYIRCTGQHGDDSKGNAPWHFRVIVGR